MSFGAGIKNIQQGTGTASVTDATLTTEDVTVTAVVMAKAKVKAWVANKGARTVSNGNPTIAPVLTSTTNLRLYIVGPSDVACAYTWQIVEYY